MTSSMKAAIHLGQDFLENSEIYKNTSCHVTHHAHGYGEHKGWSRNRPTASPSYHGRRGATRGKDANSVTWHSGTTAPGDPMPPHWADATPHW